MLDERFASRGENKNFPVGNRLVDATGTPGLPLMLPKLRVSDSCYSDSGIMPDPGKWFFLFGKGQSGA